jgi:hypothetical protein
MHQVAMHQGKTQNNSKNTADENVQFTSVTENI